MTSPSPYTIYTMSLKDTKHGTIITFVARNSTVSDCRGYPRYTNNDRYTCAYRIIWLVIQYCSFVFHNYISACVHATAVINPIHIRTALLVFVGISCCTMYLSCIIQDCSHLNCVNTCHSISTWYVYHYTLPYHRSHMPNHYCLPMIYLVRYLPHWSNTSHVNKTIEKNRFIITS